MRVKKGFEGWYFKHQAEKDMIALIPGRAESGAFVQIIHPGGSRKLDIPELSVSGGIIRAGDCTFGKNGCKIELPGIKGEIFYGELSPLKSDIMGPFRLLPMECRHGVISMAHTLRGGIEIEGRRYRLDGGTGYIEKDSGRSFPSSYLWMQCGSFPEPCSVMISVARIPFCGLSFTGCICAVIYGGREYRFATYNGVRILRISENQLLLSQGKLLFSAEMIPQKKSHPLASPHAGQMSGTVFEYLDAFVKIRLWEKSNLIFDLESDKAAYEFVPPSKA